MWWDNIKVELKKELCMIVEVTQYSRGSQPVLLGALRAPRALPRGSAAAPGK